MQPAAVCRFADQVGIFGPPGGQIGQPRIGLREPVGERRKSLGRQPPFDFEAANRQGNFVVQTVAVVWWASGIDASVASNITAIAVNGSKVEKIEREAVAEGKSIARLEANVLSVLRSLEFLRKDIRDLRAALK